MIPDFTDLYKRWKGKAPREEDKINFPQISKKEEIKITDNYGLGKAIDYYLKYSADYSLLDILQDCASLPFALGKYKSLAQILNNLGIEVVISDKMPALDKLRGLDFLERALKHWKEKLHSNDEKQRIKAEKIISEIKREIEFWKPGGGQSVLGWYLPSEKKIELFPKVMDKLSHGKNELFVFYLITTFVHEVMHAYFDRPEHDKFPYAYFVEEPLAEFGMLLFLKETIMPDVLQDWAHDNVANKRSCYRHGATLFDQYNSWNSGLRRYLEQYKYNIGEFDIPDITVVDDKEIVDGKESVKKKEIIALPNPIIETFFRGKYIFESYSKWKPGGRVYFSLKKSAFNFVAFNKAYPESPVHISLSFKKKDGTIICGDASFYKGRKCFFTTGHLTNDYKGLFGMVDGVRFRFQEIKHGEWIAEEL